MESEPKIKSCEKTEKKHVPQMCSPEACVTTEGAQMDECAASLCFVSKFSRTENVR